MSFRKYKWTFRFLILTPIFLFIVMLLAGGGHGYYQPMFVVFPFAIFTSIWFEEITILNLVFAFLQFPIYGFLIDKFEKKNIILLISVVHIILATLILFFHNENWN